MLDVTHAYERIAEHYRDAIQAGTLSPGDRLPSSTKMADEWNVSRATSRRVLEMLKSEGLAMAEVGSGTVVARSTPGFSGNIGSFARVRQMAAQFGPEAVTTYSFAGYQPAPSDVADALSIERGAEVIRRSRTRAQSGRPITMSTSWHPAEHAHALPRLLVPDNIDGGLAAIEEATGLTIGHLTERVASKLASPAQAQFFDFELPAAVLLKEHLWLDKKGQPFCYGQGVHPAGEWTSYEVDLDG